MRRTLAVLLAFAMGACATTPATTASPDEEALLRQLEDQERVALLNGDAPTLQRIWAPGFIVNAPQNQISPNREVVLDLVRRGLINHSSFERSIEEIRIVGNTAIVMGSETVQSAGVPGPPTPRRFTHVWQRAPGGWQLIARHANRIAAP
jgi:ketosteroid isomerase-like protein